MSLQQQFIDKSIKERIILRKIFGKMSNNFDWKYYLTDEFSYDLYDARLMKFKKGTGEIIDNFYIEMKCRDIHYSELMLEHKKYMDLKALVKKLDNKINKECYSMLKSKVIYISSTPEGSFLYDLSKIDFDKIEWVDKMLPASTVNKATGWINKKVCFLPTKLAKFIDIKSNDIVVNDDIIINKFLTNQRQNICIFRDLD